jgi:hypothetical protein
LPMHAIKEDKTCKIRTHNGNFWRPLSVKLKRDFLNNDCREKPWNPQKNPNLQNHCRNYLYYNFTHQLNFQLKLYWCFPCKRKKNSVTPYKCLIFPEKKWKTK